MESFEQHEREALRALAVHKFHTDQCRRDAEEYRQRFGPDLFGDHE